jgi:hypothetical protein
LIFIRACASNSNDILIKWLISNLTVLTHLYRFHISKTLIYATIILKPVPWNFCLPPCKEPTN